MAAAFASGDHEVAYCRIVSFCYYNTKSERSCLADDKKWKDGNAGYWIMDPCVRNFGPTKLRPGLTIG